MEDKIQEAIKLLQDNDYVVVKFTEKMKEESLECSTKTRECWGCSCSLCLASQ